MKDVEQILSDKIKNGIESGFTVDRTRKWLIKGCFIGPTKKLVEVFKI